MLWASLGVWVLLFWLRLVKLFLARRSGATQLWHTASVILYHTLPYRKKGMSTKIEVAGEEDLDLKLKSLSLQALCSLSS